MLEHVLIQLKNSTIHHFFLTNIKYYYFDRMLKLQDHYKK